MQTNHTTKHHGRVPELTGQRFGRLLVLSFSHVNKNQGAVWNCLCDCGNEHQVITKNLTQGITRSCGCLRKDEFGARQRTHGMTHHPLARTYRGMMERCYNPKYHNYHLYGGRGITVCDRWRESIANFVADMGERPAGYSLDRINNDGPYSPENCRWATIAEQANNKRGTRYLTYDGRTLTVTQWSEITGISRDTIYKRTKDGWDAERILTTPPRPERKRKRP